MNTDRVLQAKLRNIFATALLLLSLGAILGLMGFMVFGGVGAIAAIIGGTIAFALAPFAKNDLIMRMMRAQKLSYPQAPWLFDMVHRLSRRAGLPKPPELYMVPRGEPNAIALGTRRSPAIGVFQGLLHQLDRDELEGVLAHEIMHIRNNDTYLMHLSQLMHRLTQNIAFLGMVLIILSLPLYLFGFANPPLLAMVLLFMLPSASQLLLLAISRTREFHADLGAVALTDNPHGLASALQKLEQQRHHLLANFFPGRRQPPSWLTTHPATKERVQRIFQAAKKSQNPEPARTAPQRPQTRIVKLYHPKRFNPNTL